MTPLNKQSISKLYFLFKWSLFIPKYEVPISLKTNWMFTEEKMITEILKGCIEICQLVVNVPSTFSQCNAREKNSCSRQCISDLFNTLMGLIFARWKKLFFAKIYFCEFGLSKIFARINFRKFGLSRFFAKIYFGETDLDIKQQISKENKKTVFF